ncbi:hypothetical protein [Symmachiella dynata]|uniref:hypothetical protein n=1 Tax=Symmachiella dynata TaxID=2527995 RepID=UPI0030EC62A2
MKFTETLRKRKRPLIALGVWTLLLIILAGVGWGIVQIAAIVLLLATVLGTGCYAVFRIMYNIS